MNVPLLKAAMVEAGYTQKTLAEALDGHIIQQMPKLMARPLCSSMKLVLFAMCCI